jgi:hypothetical protein
LIRFRILNLKRKVQVKRIAFHLPLLHRLRSRPGAWYPGLFLWSPGSSFRKLAALTDSWAANVYIGKMAEELESERASIEKGRASYIIG